MNLLILAAALVCQDKPFAEGDPAKAIETAMKRAASDNRRVLVLWGKNDSENSIAVAKLFKSDKAIKKIILYEFDLVLADADRVDDKTKVTSDGLGVPWVSFYSPGRQGSWKASTDAAEMLKTLEMNKPAPLVAKEVFAAAKKKAADEKKRVLLTFGAPW